MKRNARRPLNASAQLRNSSLLTPCHLILNACSLYQPNQTGNIAVVPVDIKVLTWGMRIDSWDDFLGVWCLSRSVAGTAGTAETETAALPPKR